MSPFSWLYIVVSLVQNANPNFQPPVRCPCCNDHRRVGGHGSYWRNRYEKNERMQVPRYLCKNPDCPCLTFSQLPHPYLPMARIPLCVLMDLYRLHVVEKNTIARCARRFSHGWNTIKRAIALARRLIDFTGRELAAGQMPLWPCLPRGWPEFTRAFSYAFLPARF